ncbi:hypothetical protein M413DRAFT_64723 [Hebeloma cylindrosporum]|uniref:RlpA-like protein double-psi beta-barrel domain-containing protein n=1 Tax=Hebeloma cylindrosporum TaxID=76867 RepID=A0A0C3CQB2_HEBCY|nr:hypothetical protein M413DRAFT_64723 [Hebeloma cylindrosporum h7]
MKASRAGLSTILAIFLPALALSGRASSVRAIRESKYSTAHSLGDGYIFDPRDGWQGINVTNLQYKYRRQSELAFDDSQAGDYSAIENRSKKPKKTPKTAHNKAGLGGAITGVVNGVLKGLKGIGKPEPVIITWYTGQDLKNPSCWANGKWAPTDASFACALTMDGWSSRPKCFKFLELCHTPKRCVFVRVVDTCAGCAKGSKHVDLTRAAFRQLADFDVGVLTVQLRPATEPKQWYEKLWGPQVKEK